VCEFTNPIQVPTAISISDKDMAICLGFIFSYLTWRLVARGTRVDYAVWIASSIGYVCRECSEFN
jgi:hypothetical protein